MQKSLIETNRITRRRALLTSIASVGATTIFHREAESADAPTDNAGDGWIDAHVHVWTPNTQEYPLADGFRVEDMQPASFTPTELMHHAGPCGVRRVVLIQMSYYRFDNTYMLDVIKKFPGVYSGVAVIDENDRPVESMKRMAEQGVRGFRIRPGERTPTTWLAGDGMHAMWRYGAESGLAMCHLIDPEFLPSVEAMCQRYPRTPVVIDHFARIGIDGTIRPDDLDKLCRLAKFPQVHVKVSAYYALGKKQAPYDDLGAMIRRVLDAFGPERCMWASDCPFQVADGHTYRASIDLIRERLAFLSPSDKQWILRRTAERVYFA